MNPLCPKHNCLMFAGYASTIIEDKNDKLLFPRVGRSKYWICRKCRDEYRSVKGKMKNILDQKIKYRYKIGAEVIPRREVKI